MKYTPEQISITLGILSGRIVPSRDLKYFDDANKLYAGELRSTANGGRGNPGAVAHQRKAEEILRYLLTK